LPHPTLLLVDDDALLRQMLSDALRPSFRILVAADAPEALAILEREAVEVVMSDHYMPGMAGAELLARIAALWPDTLRILFTGAPDLSIALRAVNLGEVFRILVKPVDVDELQVVLLLAIERLRLEREHAVLRALVARNPELEAQFTAEMARRSPALALRPGDPLADLAAGLAL
jgi:two-component system NtrC family sensor kinase